MGIDMSQFYQVFFDESAEHLGEMERLLLEIDVDNPDIEQLNAIFRAAHSIKGGSGTFGFTDMTSVTHILETLLDKLRKGEMAPRTEMVDAFLEAADVLKDQLNCHVNGTDADKSLAEAICEKLRLLTDAGQAESAPQPSPQPAATTTKPKAPDTRPATHTYTITFTLDNASGKARGTFDNLLQELGRLGTVETLEQPEPQETAKPEKEKGKKGKGKKDGKKSKDKTGKKAGGEALRWKLKLVTDSDVETIRGSLEFVIDPTQVVIETMDEPAQPATAAAEEDGYGFFEPLPVTAAEDAQGYGFFTDIPAPAAAAEDAQGYGFFVDVQAPLNAQAEPPKTPAPPPRAPEAAKKAVAQPAASSATTETSSIRVSVEKVDQLINLVGELVITQAMLAQTASTVDSVLYEALQNGLAQLERNTRDMQESVMSIRMLPISFVFSRFPRVVRDLAGKLDKQVELVTVGENTELDKGLIERIADPLTHLVRNSLDHGIETPEKRIAAGKDPKGTITLSASHQGGAIVIEVADDGAGLNREKILSKAAERGLDASESMTDQEVWQLIFAPGFSTADIVTDVSGRGVGMDVVIRNITEMGGNVEIDSVTGRGTKMTVRLPLTLAILDGMSVALGDSTYVVPMGMIVETFQPNPEDVKAVTGQGEVVHIRGEYLPLLALHKIFNMEPKFRDPTQGVLVMIEDKGKRAALFVDALVGQQQVVIKSLESNYRKVSGVSGATIMGDGKVAMILDVAALIKTGQAGF